MRTFSAIAGALALAMVAASPAGAADVYSSGGLKDGAPAVVNSFAGFNVSLGVGASILNFGSTDETDVRGDVRAGYNFVNREGWLAGVYGELSLLDTPLASDPLLGYGAGIKLGKVIGQTLIYTNIGYDAITISAFSLSGFTVGGGVEYLVAPHWSIGVEADYVDYPNTLNIDGFRVEARTSFYLN